MTSSLFVTRIVNACALLEIGGHVVLTDPYLEPHAFVRLKERPGLKAVDLPRLSLVLGGHGVLDHWQPGSLAPVRDKAEIPVLVATPAMRRKAMRAGFPHVDLAVWGERRRFRDLLVEVVPSPARGHVVNSYVLSAGGIRVFVGTEVNDLGALRAYRRDQGPVDVALLPVDGSSILGRRLVTDTAAALEGAAVLGAKTLIPWHYALKTLWPILRTHDPHDALRGAAWSTHDLDVVVLPPGQRFAWGGNRAVSMSDVHEQRATP